ncbi:MAG: CapA family protein [Parvibaculum sp.]|nr:CapA family protein [Parvibaculum sp.]
MRIRSIVISALLILLAFPAQAQQRLTVVLLGDTGFNGPGARVSETGGFKRGELVTVEDAMAKIAPVIQGDVVLANLETVVTDRNDIPVRDKMFVFRTHPAHVRALVRHGIDVLPLANNHAMDLGGAGAGETLRHMEGMAGLRAFPGLGRTREEAMQPHVFVARGAKVAVSAVGNAGGGLPARNGEAGMLREDRDFAAVAARLAGEAADIRILSVHYGPEFAPLTEKATQMRFREAESAGLTIIAGHHHHVARGIELSGGKLIAYGLGNFLHLGTQDMRRFDICRDYGLVVRAGLTRGRGGYQVETVEITPITKMHIAPEPMTGDAARLRVEVMNYLGGQLSEDGLRFRPQADGSGLWCAAGAKDARCAGWQAPEASSREAEIAAACGKDVRRGNF